MTVRFATDRRAPKSSCLSAPLRFSEHAGVLAQSVLPILIRRDSEQGADCESRYAMAEGNRDNGDRQEHSNRDQDVAQPVWRVLGCNTFVLGLSVHGSIVGCRR